MLTKMPKLFLFLVVFAATTVFAGPKFEIYGRYFTNYAAVVGCTQENANKYVSKTVVVEDEGIEKSMPVKYCVEKNKRGQTYHAIEAECHNKDCTWSGTMWWYDYDKKGHVVHTKNNKGYETWYDYDKNGKRTHSKDNDGREKWYDKNGKRTYYKDSDGLEILYDKNGKRTHIKDSDGLEIWYDENGNITHYYLPEGNPTYGSL